MVKSNETIKFLNFAVPTSLYMKFKDKSSKEDLSMYTAMRMLMDNYCRDYEEYN